jgi:hypothetical protein
MRQVGTKNTVAISPDDVARTTGRDIFTAGNVAVTFPIPSS